MYKAGCYLHHTDTCSAALKAGKFIDTSNDVSIPIFVEPTESAFSVQAKDGDTEAHRKIVSPCRGIGSGDKAFWADDAKLDEKRCLATNTRSAKEVQVNFGSSVIEACTGDLITVTWEGS